MASSKSDRRSSVSGISSASGIVRSVGTQNFQMRDVPCLIPRENVKFFNQMRKSSGTSSFGSFPNPFDAFWRGSGK